MCPNKTFTKFSSGLNLAMGPSLPVLLWTTSTPGSAPLELQQPFCYQPEDGDGKVQINTPGSSTGASNPFTAETTPTPCFLIL